MQSQDDGDSVGSNSNIETSPTSNLAELDLLIGQIEDYDKANLRAYEECDDDSEGVHDGFESEEEDENNDAWVYVFAIVVYKYTTLSSKLINIVVLLKSASYMFLCFASVVQTLCSI